MLSFSLFVVSGIILGISMALCSRLAERKGRDPKRWEAMGLAFGLLAVAYLAMVRPRQRESAS